MSPSIEAFVARLPAPVTTSFGVIDERRGFYVRAAGACGEATPLPAFGTEDLETCEAVLRGSSTAFAPCARHALDQLALGQDPAATLAARVDVVVTASPPARALLGVPDHADAGRSVKLKCVDVDETVQRVRSLRGRGLRLRLDFNGALDEQQARALLRAIDDDDGVEWLEQPVAAADVDGLCALARDFKTVVAADEALIDAAARAQLLRARAPLAFLWKPQAVGGASVVVDAVARLPSRVHIVSGFFDTPIAQSLALATARVVDAITRTRRAHGFGMVAQVRG